MKRILLIASFALLTVGLTLTQPTYADGFFEWNFDPSSGSAPLALGFTPGGMPPVSATLVFPSVCLPANDTTSYLISALDPDPVSGNIQVSLSGYSTSDCSGAPTSVFSPLVGDDTVVGGIQDVGGLVDGTLLLHIYAVTISDDGGNLGCPPTGCV